MYSLRARTAPVMFAIVSHVSTPDKPVVLHYSSCMYQLYIPVVCICILFIQTMVKQAYCVRSQSEPFTGNHQGYTERVKRVPRCGVIPRV